MYFVYNKLLYNVHHSTSSTSRFLRNRGENTHISLNTYYIHYKSLIILYRQNVHTFMYVLGTCRMFSEFIWKENFFLFDVSGHNFGLLGFFLIILLANKKLFELIFVVSLKSIVLKDTRIFINTSNRIYYSWWICL